MMQPTKEGWFLCFMKLVMLMEVKAVCQTGRDAPGRGGDKPTEN